jgi:predicted lipoprotein with Yx(FWY)xxD motif
MASFGRVPLTARKIVGSAVLALSATALGAGVAVPAASAGPVAARTARATTSAVVVKVAATRGKFKKVLTTTSKVGATLYTAASCSGSCLTVWPPLFMPAGKTTPEGVAGLGTKKVGSKLQVTYKGHLLYTFTGDSGASVNGNGVAGFKVVTVS